jgi:hypothetical protein
LTTPPSSRQADMPAIDDLSFGYRPLGEAPLQRAIAQRFSALAHLRHRTEHQLRIIEVARTDAKHEKMQQLSRRSREGADFIPKTIICTARCEQLCAFRRA